MHPYPLVLQCNGYCVIMLKRKQPVNYLDMVPVRKVSEFTDSDNRITLLIPKFKNKWLLTWLIPEKRSKQFRIHLDEHGSSVWRLIDGVRNTGEICNLINEPNTEVQSSSDEMEIRITKFLSQLYKNRFIVFR
jgi:hypothetical protein